MSYIIGCLFLMLFVWVSCDNEDNRMQTTGYLELGVSKNVEVVTRGFDVKESGVNRVMRLNGAARERSLQ